MYASRLRVQVTIGILDIFRLATLDLLSIDGIIAKWYFHIELDSYDIN